MDTKKMRKLMLGNEETAGEEAAKSDDKAAASSTLIYSQLYPELQRVEELLAQAQHGDAAAAGAVGKFFDDDSAAWREAGDLANLARKSVASMLFGSSPAMAMSVERRMRLEVEELLDEDSSPLERTMADRLVLARAFAHGLDISAAASGEALTSPATTKAQEHAERRCQNALKSFQLAREISRGPAARPLKLVFSKEGDGEGRPEKRQAT